MSPSQNRKIKTYSNKSRAKKNKLIIATAIIAIILISVVGYVVATNLGKGNTANTVKPTPTPTITPSPTTVPTSTAFNTSNVVPATSPAGEYSSGGHQVLFITSMGDIVIQMRDDKPITTGNFLDLVNEGYYNNTVFHRVIAGFMIQGGEGATNVPTINDEIGNDNHNST